MAKLLFLESFNSGSHKFFMDKIISKSKFEFDKITIDQESWKLNFYISPLYFYQKIENIEQYDAVFTTSLTDIASLKSFYKKFPKIIYYFHENQFAYPFAKTNYEGILNINSILASDYLIFNSNFHKNDTIEKWRYYLKKFTFPKLYLDEIENRLKNSEIVYPGFDYENIKNLKIEQKKDKTATILWNHRWSEDKNWKTFFSAMKHLKKNGYKFKIAFLGEHFKHISDEFQYFKNFFNDEITHFGYLESKEEYYKVVKSSSIVVSCAMEENFGISIVEAIGAGALPILPNRLSYPELIPEKYHSLFLYNSYNDFTDKLKTFINHPVKSPLIPYFKKFDIKNSVKKLDNLISKWLEK